MHTDKNTPLKIGIWGFGIVGKGVSDFFVHYSNRDNRQTLVSKNSFAPALLESCCLEVFDQRILTDTEKQFLADNHITLATDKSQFLETNDYIIPSPGISLDAEYEKYRTKWICELDLFAYFFSQKTVAITGSVGKTSTTKLLSDILLAMGNKIAMGGNIGIACLDLIKSQQSVEYAVLEVSSAQLAYTQAFAPDIAIITNITPNHLDWHKHEEAYFNAKCTHIARQTADQFAIMPLNLKERIYSAYTLKSKPVFFTTSRPSDDEFATITAHEILFYLDENILYVYEPVMHAQQSHMHTRLISFRELPPITFNQNWLIVCSTLYLMNINVATLPSIAQTLSIPEHRLEKCATYRTVTIYNDSKATLPASTLAAIERLSQRPIILIVGGLSKGVNREPFIASLKHKVKKVYTFGAESENLALFCATYAIPVHKCTALEEVVALTLQDADGDDQILFSPAGSSYDLFKDYIHRGIRFKELVFSHINEIHKKSIHIQK